MKKILMVGVVLMAGLMLGCTQTAEERMIAALVEKNGHFDAQQEYEKYLTGWEKYLQTLQQCAACAADMRVKISLDYGQETEFMALNKDEIAAVREVFAVLKNTPPRDFNTWLKEKYDSNFGPQPAALSYGVTLEFLSMSGEVEGCFYTLNEEMGDAAKAEQYRIAVNRPGYMLPTAVLERWNSLEFRTAAQKRIKELLEVRAQARSKEILGPQG